MVQSITPLRTNGFIQNPSMGVSNPGYPPRVVLCTQGTACLLAVWYCVILENPQL